ncbi:MAG TPA: LysR family transcriptional regulator [Burkholderiaceae bacterium]|nr:LysR family transcriptional regulator [Burkholderiaceae bacterium]
MDRFQAMQIFTRVVDANSFSHAADSLGLPRSTVSSTVQRLEQTLGVRLLNRTTRRLSLTPDGAAYYERCTQLLAELEDIETSFRDVTRGPRGRLRVEMKASIGRLILVPALCDFHTRYPDIKLAIGMSDRPVDMVRDAIDCAIRVGELKDSSLIARRIGSFESITCAAPSYIESYGEPLTIEDLDEHHAVHYFSERTGRIVDWSFMVDGQQRDVQVKGMVSVDDGEAYVKCGLKGFGMIQAPRYMVAPFIASGELKEVLAEWTPPPLPISVVYLHNRHLSPKVRVFVDWVSELFQNCPLMSDCKHHVYDPVCNFAGKKGAQINAREYLEGQETAETVF